MSFFAELKRRNVFRVGIAYVLSAWVLAQAADFALDLIGAPNWILQSIVVVIAIGFPLALIFAWAFEMTPEGIKRESDVDRDASITPQTGKKLDRAIIAVMALVIVVLLVDRFNPGGTDVAPEPDRPVQTSTPQEPGPKETQSSASAKPVAAEEGGNSIAVLPFVNMSADAENEFFSDGVSEEILNVLARIPELKVAARTSAFAYKGMNTKIADIARELGVNHILEGSVRKAGDQVRVTAQLIKADDGFHLWSETYDRQLDNIFAIQDEIATAIAAELKVSLGLEAGAAGNLTGTSSLAAYEHYLQGMSLWHQRTAQSLLNAVNEFIAAINLDEGFAKAHAGLAVTFAVLPGYITTDVDDAIERAEKAARRALELDPENVEAMAALGLTARYQANFEEAMQWFEQALMLNPSFATAHQWYGVVLEYMGDLDASLRLLERAWSLDPKSRIIGYNLAWRLQGANRMQEALEVNRRVLEIAPDFPDGAEQAMLFAIINRDCESVTGYANRVAALLNKQTNSAETYVALCRAETSDERAEALDTIFSWAPLEFVDPENPTLTYPYDVRLLLVELGEYDAVYELLKVSPEDDLELGNLRGQRTPRGIEFHCQERWRELERQAGLPEPVDPVPCPDQDR